MLTENVLLCVEWRLIPHLERACSHAHFLHATPALSALPSSVSRIRYVRVTHQCKANVQWKPLTHQDPYPKGAEFSILGYDSLELRLFVSEEHFAL